MAPLYLAFHDFPDEQTFEKVQAFFGFPIHVFLLVFVFFVPKVVNVDFLMASSGVDWSHEPTHNFVAQVQVYTLHELLLPIIDPFGIVIHSY